MKSVAFALALLLVVGSQAASLQADAPTQLQHIRAAIDVYLNQVKDSANKVVAELDESEYSELKASLSQSLEDMHTKIKALQGVVSPITDNVVTTISDATAELRASIMSDIDYLKADIEPKRVQLKEVVNKHIDEYRVLLEPIIKEYQEKHTNEMDAMKLKIEPVIDQLRNKIAINVEETKKALEPIVDSVRSKLTERLENLKMMVTPYVDEYKDQVKQAYQQAQSFNAEELQTLREKIAPLTEDVKGKLQEIFAVIADTFSKN